MNVDLSSACQTVGSSSSSPAVAGQVLLTVYKLTRPAKENPSKKTGLPLELVVYGPDNTDANIHFDEMITVKPISGLYLSLKKPAHLL